MARIKSGPSGLYYDANDTGPDQGTPEEIAAFKAKQSQTSTQTPDYNADGSQRQTTDPNAPGYDPGVTGKTLDPSQLKYDGPLQGPLYQYLLDPTKPFDLNGQHLLNTTPADAGSGSTWTTPQQQQQSQVGSSSTPQYQFMEGVDMNKLNDASHQTPKYLIARQLASGQPVSEAIKAVPGTVQLDETRFKLPTGEVIDTRRDEEGANALQWLVQSDPKAPQSAAGTATTSGSIGSGGLSGLAGGNFSDLFNAIMGKANQSLDVNRKDPIIANQVNAYDAAQVRAGRDYLRQQAEQAGPIGNLNQEARMVAEKRGQNLGAFEAQLMQQELTARRNEIMQALQLGASYMTDQQKLALQKQLADMDNALQYAQLGQRAYEFDTDDEFRRSPLAS